MFRAFGHQKSSILDGGLPRWVAEGFDTVGGTPGEEKRSTYPTPVFQAEAVRCETSFALSTNRVFLRADAQPMSKWSLTPSRTQR